MTRPASCWSTRVPSGCSTRAIPTAVNIPDSEFDKHVDKLPKDKATPLIFYCGGLECVLSNKSADKARQLGYTDIKTYPKATGMVQHLRRCQAGGGDRAGKEKAR